MMGAQLVARVYTSWTHLPDRPIRLLAFMALTAKDTDKTPRYYGGRDRLAEVLGHTPGTDSANTMVKRAIRDLVNAGALTRDYYGHAGKRSEYVLSLIPEPVENVEKGVCSVPPQGVCSVPPQGVGSVPPEGVTSVPERGYSGDPIGGTQQTPLGTTRNHRGTQQESILSTPVVSPSRRVEARKASESRLEELRKRTDAERSAS